MEGNPPHALFYTTHTPTTHKHTYTDIVTNAQRHRLNQYSESVKVRVCVADRAEGLTHTECCGPETLTGADACGGPNTCRSPTADVLMNVLRVCDSWAGVTAGLEARRSTTV